MYDEIENTYPPSRLGEYTVIREIAEGTFGKVKSEFSFRKFIAGYMEELRIDGNHIYQWPYIQSPVIKSR